MRTDRQTFVIVGAGMAGAKAAETLRDEGFDGRLVLLGAEPDPPYERPPLSKEYLRGEAEREQSQVHPAAFYAEHDIELRTGADVVALDPERRELALEGGERLAFDRVLLTTGAAPRRLSLPGTELDGVHYLRTLADSDALRARFGAGGKLVVIGAGWIGCEVAASARQCGMDVTVVAPDAVPLERVLGPEVGAIYRDIHLDHGTEMLLGTAVQSIDCDAVVVRVGATPRVRLAEAAGIETGDGVLVDERLQMGAPGVFAAATSP